MARNGLPRTVNKIYTSLAQLSSGVSHLRPDGAARRPAVVFSGRRGCGPQAFQFDTKAAVCGRSRSSGASFAVPIMM